MDVISNLDWYISFSVSVLLALMATWGLVGFFPKKSDRGNSGPAWLILAIWLGFLGNGLNAFYWRVAGDMVGYYRPDMWPAYRDFGNIWGDMLWKGLAMVSIYLHFYARYKSIPAEEQKHWTPLAMGFYPNDGHWAARALTFWRRGRLTKKNRGNDVEEDVN